MHLQITERFDIGALLCFLLGQLVYQDCPRSNEKMVTCDKDNVFYTIEMNLIDLVTKSMF